MYSVFLSLYLLLRCLSIIHKNFPLQILKNKAQSRLKIAADRHWSDGALEVLSLSPLLILYIITVILHCQGLPFLDYSTDS